MNKYGKSFLFILHVKYIQSCLDLIKVKKEVSCLENILMKARIFMDFHCLEVLIKNLRIALINLIAEIM